MQHSKWRARVPWAASGLFLGLVALMGSLASPAYAYPTKASACTSCHGTSASGRVVATQTANDGTTATYSVAVSGFPAGDPVGWALLNGSTNVARATSGTGSFSMPVGATYTLWAADPNAGAVSVKVSPVAPAPVPAAATSLVMAGDFSAQAGSPISVTGVLTAAGVPVAGKTVVLQLSTDGIAWAPADTAVSAADGSVAFSPVPEDGWAYRLDFAGDAGYAASTSGSQTAIVSPVPPAAATPTAITVGGNFSSIDGSPAIVVSGTLSADGSTVSGEQLVLEVSKDGGSTWTAVTSAATGPDGGVSFSPAASDGWLYRLSFAGTATLAPSVSDGVKVSVTVTAPPSTGLSVTAPSLSVANPVPGKAIRFSATVANGTGGKVTFTVYMRNGHGRWHRVRVLSSKLSADGSFVSRSASFGRGTYRVVASYAGTDGKASSTATAFAVLKKAPVRHGSGHESD